MTAQPAPARRAGGLGGFALEALLDFDERNYVACSRGCVHERCARCDGPFSWDSLASLSYEPHSLNFHRCTEEERT